MRQSTSVLVAMLWAWTVTCSAAEPVEKPDAPGAVVAIKKLNVQLEYDDHGHIVSVNFPRSGFAFGSSFKNTDAACVHLKGLPHLRRVKARTTDISDAGLVHLGEITWLEELNLSRGIGSRTVITPAGLTHLKGLTGLKILNLSNRGIRDEAIIHLTGFSKLESLSLYGSRVSRAGAYELVELSNLRRLYLGSSSRIDDSALEYLGRLKELRELDIGGARGTGVTGAGLVRLKRLSKLEVLGLSRLSLSDEGVAHLKGLTSLKELDLQGADLTDAGLEHLKTMKGLVSIDLRDTYTTAAGREQLRKALPDAKIHASFFPRKRPDQP
ncbi:MAG: hypothetical protein HQ567_15820 [Candidatus Nealsonbacteria bacterium]|nr:hypothetical protein [Candidatus Nealsonbacteria bacterium]